MNIIIAGGRNLCGDLRWINCLVRILIRIPIVDCIVSGGARGADTFGENFAVLANIPIRRFPADWNRLGKSAGYKRNVTMAEFADAAIILPGGKGTDHMFDIAMKHNLWVFDVRCKKEIRIVRYNTPTKMEGRF